jgi:hypothetical protein
MSQTREPYNHTYPDSLPWSKRIFLLEEGQVLSRDGKLYVIKQVIRSRLEEQPRIVLEEQSSSEQQN